MIGRMLLKKIIKEVPEELTVCVFDCPESNCTGRKWAECELRHQNTLCGNDITQHNTPILQLELPAITAIAIS
jgi:hypothetical protein